MNQTEDEDVVILTWVYSEQSRYDAHLMIKSLRSFGSSLSGCPVWVFDSTWEDGAVESLLGEGIKTIWLDTPEEIRDYLYGHKVYACALAEKLAPEGTHSLIWLSPEMLVVQPPELFRLAGKYGAAVRPVHIQNVGLEVTQTLDGFWRGVYQAVGVPEVEMQVESFVDAKRLRAYFNSAAFAVDPRLGLCQRWLDTFRSLVMDQEFQESACGDDWHQVFLHQAVLSALLASEIPPERLRILPPDYIYPYNLHTDVPPVRAAGSMEELVCIYHDGRSLNPEKMDDIELGNTLKLWLKSKGIK